MKKRHNRMIIAIVAMALLLMPLQSFAATTNNFFDGQMSITDTSGKGKGNAAEYTITVSSRSSATNTITIANESDADATISFGYSVTGHNSFTIAGEAVAAKGECSKTIAAGGEFEIKLTVKGSIISQKTATLTLTNITFSHMVSSSEITFNFDESLGTVTTGEENVSSGSAVTIGASGAEFVATPVTDAVFVGWVDKDGKIISRNSSYTQQSVGNITVSALFSKTTPYFLVDNTYILSDLNEAANKGNTLVLLCKATLPAGNYVIPQGVTLLIPFNGEHTLYTTVPEIVEGTYKKPTIYRTLTMAKNAKITVNGAISVSAKQSCKIQYNGSPVSAVGHINMKSGSSITVNSGGNLYVWGYISGSGKITAKSGATVYEDFQVRDWRGGDATSKIIDNSQRVFPMSQYYVQNIQVPLTLEAGAVENGYMSVDVSLIGPQGSSIPFIGPNGMFKINSGSVTKDYDEATDRLIINVNGDLSMSALNISMNLGLVGTKTINSKKYILPINGGITLNVNSGRKVTISQDMALLPGGEINVYSGAECIVSPGTKIFIYDSEEWGNYNYPHKAPISPVAYAYSRKYTRSDTDVVDAKVYVEGTIDAYDGNIYVTESGADIQGAEGGLVKFKPDNNATVTYYVKSDGDSNVSYHEIPITTAKMKNADGNYFEHDGLHTEFVNSNGAWEPKHNTVSYGAKDVTCEEIGWNAYEECSLCDYSTYQEIAALGHNYVDFICTGCGKEKIATSTEYSIADSKITINCKLIEEVPPTSLILIATYDLNDKMLDSKIYYANALSEVTFNSQSVNKIKVFSWVGFSTIKPLSMVEEIPVAQ